MYHSNGTVYDQKEDSVLYLTQRTKYIVQCAIQTVHMRTIQMIRCTTEEYSVLYLTQRTKYIVHRTIHTVRCTTMKRTAYNTVINIAKRTS